MCYANVLSNVDTRMQTDLTDIGQRMTLTLVHLLSMFNVSAIARWIVVADCAMFAYARGRLLNISNKCDK